MKSWVKLALAVPAGLALLAAGTTAALLPALTAALCPPCYGLQKIAPNLYTDTPSPLLTSQQSLAKALVFQAFGGLRSDPLILACHTAECDARLGGAGSLGVTYGAFLIRLAPGGLTVEMMSHEMAHAELHQRVGMAAMARGAVPAWLDEGLAVLISQDPRHLGKGGQDHPACREMDPASLPQTSAVWAARAPAEHLVLYPQAACAARDWLATRGGLAALPRLFP